MSINLPNPGGGGGGTSPGGITPLPPKCSPGMATEQTNSHHRCVLVSNVEVDVTGLTLKHKLPLETGAFFLHKVNVCASHCLKVAWGLEDKPFNTIIHQQ